MNKMEVIKYDTSLIYEFIKDNIYSCRTAYMRFKDCVYHHNSSYKTTPSILKLGLLSYNKQVELKVQEEREEERRRFDLYDHINGTEYISLSKKVLDAYRDEEIYEPTSNYSTDIRIDSSVPTFRTTDHYSNEFLAKDMVSKSLFRALDIRLLSKKFITSEWSSRSAIDNYNELRNIALALKSSELDIPLREKADEYIGLDIDKVIKLPTLKVK